MALHPLTWLLATLALAAGWWTLAWLGHNSRHRQLAWITALAELPASWLSVAQLLYLAGVPLLTLALRIVPPVRMGLIGPNSARTSLLAVGVVVAGVAMLLIARRHFDLALQRAPVATWRWPSMPDMGWALLGALCLELHWAFFRAATLTLPFATVGQAVMLALGLLALEGWSNPWRRAALAEPDQSRDLAQGAVLALASAGTFLLTGSSLLALLLHVLARGALTVASPVADSRAAPTVLGPEVDAKVV